MNPDVKKAKKKSTVTEAERREMVLLGMSKKKECETKALAIVQRLALADEVDREWFRDAAFYLNTSHYEDIVDERSCGQICGYPLCPNELTDTFSKQKYHISSKLNKVFDVTERKKFCSNICFKSSNVYKEQIGSCPLWLREKEDRVRVNFHDEISAELKRKLESVPGEEIKFSPISESLMSELRAQRVKSSTAQDSVINEDENEESLIEPDVKVSDRVTSTKSVRFSSESTQDSNSTTSDPEKCDDVQKLEQTMKDVKLTEEPRKAETVENLQKDETPISEKQKDDSVSLSSTEEVASQTNGFRPRERTKKTKSEKSAEIPALERVTHCMQEWYTIETLRLLCGDKFLRQLLVENNLADQDYSDQDFIADIPDQVSPEVRARYIRLCQQLDMQELRELNEERKMLEPDSGNAFGIRKKLPDYEQLKKDVEMQQQKLNAYFQGKTDFDLASQIKERPVEETLDRLSAVPLVDRHAQGALRRRIVNEHLDRVLPDLLKLFNLLRNDINDILRKLIFSFDFGPENIAMKTQEWTLVALVLLKMIGRANKKLGAEMNTESSQKYLNLMLLGYGTNLNYLEQFIDSLHSDLHAILARMSN